MSKDRYLQTKEPVYRYHYYAHPEAIKQTKVDTSFDITLGFGSSATLAPHRTWMLAIESFHMEFALGENDKVALVIGRLGQTSERSNAQHLDGTSAVFNINGPHLELSPISTSFIGHRITNPNFLNDVIPIRIISTEKPTFPNVDDPAIAFSLQFTLVIYAYD